MRALTVNPVLLVVAAKAHAAWREAGRQGRVDEEPPEGGLRHLHRHCAVSSHCPGPFIGFGAQHLVMTRSFHVKSGAYAQQIHCAILEACGSGTMRWGIP